MTLNMYTNTLEFCVLSNSMKYPFWEDLSGREGRTGIEGILDSSQCAHSVLYNIDYVSVSCTRISIETSSLVIFVFPVRWTLLGMVELRRLVHGHQEGFPG